MPRKREGGASKTVPGERTEERFLGGLMGVKEDLGKTVWQMGHEIPSMRSLIKKGKKG